jgi:hypothetical protein
MLGDSVSLTAATKAMGAIGGGLLFLQGTTRTNRAEFKRSAKS